MKSKIKIFFCIYSFFVFSNKANAQLGFSSEIGFFVGSVGFQSDYGEGKSIAADINSGFGIGVVHFVNFAVDDRGYFNNSSYFSDRFKLRTELSHSKSDFKYSGRWIEGNPSDDKRKLAAMYGNTSITNFSMQLEFFPRSVRDFTENIGSLGPYICFGAQYSFYTSEAKSSLGVPGTDATTFPKYLIPTDDRPFGFSSESKPVFSVVSGIGLRYKIAESSDLMLELRGQYYFSDWVDGLKPNPDVYKENKTNDYLLWLSFGYVYSLR